MRTSDKILQIALELFNTKGYQDVGVREIARELDISPGNLSYHFSRKEDILIALFERFRVTNNALYTEYDAGSPTNADFLRLIRSIFYSQFRHRGIFVGLPYMQQEINKAGGFDYAQNARRREQNFFKIFTGLVVHHQIKASESDIEFLVSFMTLFGRFWISEAFLVRQEREENEVVQHYLGLISWQLSLFATMEGQESIQNFWESLQP